MTNKELLEEIRMNRDEIKDLHREFYIFKGKALGFISLLSVVINLAFNHLLKEDSKGGVYDRINERTERRSISRNEDSGR